jgi:methylated-DNA-[protein]-cysteine S-methyltransferase
MHSAAITQGCTPFETTLGSCAIAWNGDAITGVQLPGATHRSAIERLRGRFPDCRELAPTPLVQRVIADIVALLNGCATDLTYVPLHSAGVPEFESRVYALTRAIPPGVTRTYGEVAADLGDAALARAVGQALGRNPWPIVVPCHRVLASGGRMHGFSAPGGIDTKYRMLMIEGAPAAAQLALFG